MTERFFHSLVANLLCVPEDSSSNPCGKGKEVVLFGSFGLVAEPRVDSTLLGIAAPILPRGFSGRIIHCCSPNGCPRSVKITFDQIPEGGWTLRQRLFCGRGYEELKSGRNDWGHIADGVSNKW